MIENVKFNKSELELLIEGLGCLMFHTSPSPNFVFRWPDGMTDYEKKWNPLKG